MSYNPEEIARRRIGATLKGKWHLDSLLGVGGMAAVYAATHRNGNRVAIKMLHPQLSAEPDLRKRFLREGYVANSVGHPGAVRVLDDDETEDGAVFLVMELLEGETLESRMDHRKGRLPPDEVLTSASMLLAILSSAHANGVYHRDIKPENVFLTRDGELKILDFGIARLIDSKSGARTHTGIMMGTPAFMPPEQALGHSSQIDGRTDLWAVGAMMFRLLLGRYVHEGETPNVLLIRAATRPAPRVQTLWPQCPPSLAHVIDRALEFERDKRWQNADEMQAAVQQALHHLPAEQTITTADDSALDSQPTRVIPARGSAPELPHETVTRRRPPTPAAAATTTEEPPAAPRRPWALVAVGLVALLGLIGLGLSLRSRELTAEAAATSPGGGAASQSASSLPVVVPAASSAPVATDTGPPAASDTASSKTRVKPPASAPRSSGGKAPEKKPDIFDKTY